MNVHFICRGNILRSFIAETYLRSLGLKNVTVLSSGVVADAERENTRLFLVGTHKLLKEHGIDQFSKANSEQLTQDRIGNADITVCMNDIVIEQANTIVTLPKNTRNWHITDIGEGNRIITDGDRTHYEAIIYQEIINKVNELVTEYELT